MEDVCAVSFYGLVMLLAMVNNNAATCTGSDADRVYYCKTFQKDYSEGTKTLIFEERDVGLINSTVFSSPNLKSVVTLTLTGSRIDTIESGAFEQFSSLITLELQNNKLTTVLPSWFRDPAVLEQLNLAGNLIRHLSLGMLEGYSCLKVLNLSRNEINRIESESFTTLSKLSSLDLSFNKLTSIERKLFTSLNATLRLQGNPWNCSCGQKDFILFLQELVNTSKLNDSTLVTCSYPPDLSGMLVWNVSEVNCSTSALSPSSAAVFHQVVLPALFVVLAIFLFILLIFLGWKKKQDQKQVRPDKRTVGEMEARDTQRAIISGDMVLVTSDAFGRMACTNLPQQERATLARAKSASAILIQGSFHQVNVKEDVKELNKLQLGKNPVVKLKTNLGSQDEVSKGNMELWYYNRLQSGSINWSPTAESGLLNEVSTGFLKHSGNVHLSSSEVASTKTVVVTRRLTEHEDQPPTSVMIPDVQEPFVYLCVRTAPEDSLVAGPMKKETSNNLLKPRRLKRTFTWPNERLRCKEDTSDSYVNFLKTLNISPRPGQSHFASHTTKKTKLQTYDSNSKTISLKDTGENGLLKDTKTVRPGRPIEKRNNGEPKSRGGQRYTNSPTKVSQRSSYGKQTSSNKVVSLDSGVQREDLNSQESEAQSDLRRTPDDEKLLENNEYHFIDLLHEVVENHGRWTRERWRQTHQKGGLFFALSMWMIICFLRSQCKNKVTNMADSKRNLQSCMEQEEGHVMSRDNHNQIFENHLKDATKNGTDVLLHELDLNNSDTENSKNISVQSHQPVKCGGLKTDRFVYPGIRADNSKREGISKCLSAPVLLPCASKSSLDTLKKAEEPMGHTTKVHADVTVTSIKNSVTPATTEVSFKPLSLTTAKIPSELAIFPSIDSTHLEATEQACDITGILSINTESILPADKFYNLGLKLNNDEEIDQKASEKSPVDFNHEIGLVKYFETHVELMGSMINEAHIGEGAMKEHTGTSSEEKDSPLSKLENSRLFCKKSKTWTNFYDSENYLVHFQPKTETEPNRPIDLLQGRKKDKTEGICGSCFMKEVQEDGRGVCSNLTDVSNISSVDQSQWTDADEQPGPSNVSQRQKARHEQNQALNAQMVRERLWKYHKNCCDEYQPCQSASKVLKQIRALEKTQLMQKTKQSPPSDEDLLEEIPSLPLLPITLSKDHAMTNQASVSNLTCASLPNLSQYGSHWVCAFHEDPSLKGPVLASVNLDDNSAIVTSSFAGSDQPGIYAVHGEHLKNVFPYYINVPVLEDQTQSFARSEKEMNTLLSSSLALPIIAALAVDVVGGKTSLDDRSVSHVALPIINAPTEATACKNVSTSSVELPIVCEPLLGIAAPKTNLENMMTSNLHLPVTGFHKIELPAIQIGEGRDYVRDSQSVEPELSNSNTIIGLPEPIIAGTSSFENQSLQFNIETKTQESQILSKPEVEGVSVNIENNVAAICSSASNPFIGMIPKHGEITTEETASAQPQELLEHTEISNMSLHTQTHLTSSISYSNSIQDGEEGSDWPKIADLLKHSSTISLSSNFDILNPNFESPFNPKPEKEYDTSDKSKTDLSVVKCERGETMNQPCHIDDHKNMAVEGLSFNCAVLQQYDMEPEDRKSSNGMQNKTLYIQEGTRQLCGTPSEEKRRLRILNTQGIVKDQTDMNCHFLEYAEKARIQMENPERIKGMSHNLDSHTNRDIVDHKSCEDSTHVSNLDMVVNTGPEIQASEDPRRDQTEGTEYTNDITVNHKGHHLTTPCNNRHSDKFKAQEDLLNDHKDANIEKSECEYPQSQTNIDNRSNSDLSTAVIIDEAVDFKGYEEKLNVRVNNNCDLVGEHSEDISNLFQDILGFDSTSASERIDNLAGNKRKDSLSAEMSSDNLKTNYESDDSTESKCKLKKRDCNMGQSINELRKASGDVANCRTFCNSDATFDDGQANQGRIIDASLCNNEIPMKVNKQLLVQKVPKKYTKQMQSDQKSQTNRQLKTTNNVAPADVKNKRNLKDYLSSRIYTRPFYSVFPFSSKTRSTEEGEMVENSGLEGKALDSDSDTTKPSPVLSDRYTKNKRMEAMEYLTYLYARSPQPKTCSGSLECLNMVSDMDDISVLANLHFCKVALPGEVTKQEKFTAVQEGNVDHNLEPADQELVYVPPNKEELKRDDELAVLHVMYTLKKSLELFPNSETETD